MAAQQLNDAYTYVSGVGNAGICRPNCRPMGKAGLQAEMAFLTVQPRISLLAECEFKTNYTLVNDVLRRALTEAKQHFPDYWQHIAG